MSPLTVFLFYFPDSVYDIPDCKFVYHPRHSNEATISDTEILTNFQHL